MSIKANLEAIQQTIPADVTLVAVSKTKPVSEMALVVRFYMLISHMLQ